MILDATAANRKMWQVRDSDNIIYIDQQTKLDVPPTLFCDNTNTPFADKKFHTIFYDPPHDWGLPSLYWGFASEKEKQERFKDFKGIPAYYGTEIYEKREELVLHIFKAQREFYRILKDDGLLWFKWNETKLKLRHVLTVFALWQPIMTIPVDRRGRGLSKEDTYWVCMEKKTEGYKQVLLPEVVRDEELPVAILQTSKLRGAQSYFGVRRPTDSERR